MECNSRVWCYDDQGECVLCFGTGDGEVVGQCVLCSGTGGSEVIGDCVAVWVCFVLRFFHV